MKNTLDIHALQTELAENPDCILETLADRYRVPVQTVVESLPGEMRVRVPGGAFPDVMADVAKWGSVTVIVHTRDLILECQAALPPGKMGHGFYNLQGAGPLSGHLRADHCESIYFVRRPFMGKDTLSIQFFNGEGHTMFKVYVGRDAQRNLKVDQVDLFNALARRVALPEAA